MRKGSECKSDEARTRVLVREEGAIGLHDGTRSQVLRGNELESWWWSALSSRRVEEQSLTGELSVHFFVNKLLDLRILFSQGRVETLVEVAGTG
jgi:hypothetical protein